MAQHDTSYQRYHLLYYSNATATNLLFQGDKRTYKVYRDFERHKLSGTVPRRLLLPKNLVWGAQYVDHFGSGDRSKKGNRMGLFWQIVTNLCGEDASLSPSSIPQHSPTNHITFCIAGIALSFNLVCLYLRSPYVQVSQRRRALQTVGNGTANAVILEVPEVVYGRGHIATIICCLVAWVCLGLAEPQN